MLHIIKSLFCWGNFRLKGLSIEPGTRRPLVVSAGGVAMLLTLPLPEQRRIEKNNLRQIASVGEARVSAVQAMLRRSRQRGFGINLEDVVPGLDAFGVALRDSAGQVIGSITVAMPAQPAPAARIAAMQALLNSEARRFEEEQSAQLAEPIRVDVAKYARLAQQANIKPE